MPITDGEIEIIDDDTELKIVHEAVFRIIEHARLIMDGILDGIDDSKIKIDIINKINIIIQSTDLLDKNTKKYIILYKILMLLIYSEDIINKIPEKLYSDSFLKRAQLFSEFLIIENYCVIKNVDIFRAQNFLRK